MDSPRHRRSAGALWLLLHDLDPPHLHLRQKSRSRKTREPARTRTSFGLRAIGVDDKRTHATFPRCPRVFGARTGFQTHSILQRSRADDISKRGAAQWSWVPSAVDRRHREVTSAVLGTGFKSPNGMATARFHDPDWNPRCGSGGLCGHGGAREPGTRPQGAGVAWGGIPADS